MDTDPPAFTANTQVSTIMRAVADHDAMHYAVLGPSRRVLGRLGLDRLKQCLADMEMGDWLVAADLMVAEDDVFRTNTPLAEAVQRLREAQLDALPVVNDANQQYAGMLELRTCEKRISQEVWRRKRLADSVGMVT
jgi:hypothetical protein